MDYSSTTQDGLMSPQEPKTDTPASMNRKVVPKTRVTVRMEASVGKQKGEGPPSDSWSWRKYGQKLIKGSPYPRGYYRCSTSKGCSARKQVERCKTDASVLLITYTSAHNHSTSPPKLLLRNSPIPTSPKQHIPTCKEGPNSESLSLPSPPECSQASTQEDPEVQSDFFDELEELPVPSSLTSLMRSSFFDERTLLFTTLS